VSRAPRPRWLVAVEASSLVASAGLWLAVFAGHAALALGSPGGALLGLGAGVAAADLASGVVHWLCDCFGDERTPVVGPLVIAPFREHHRDPASILEHGVVELCGTNALVVLPVLAAAPALLGAAEGAPGSFLWGLLAAGTAFGAATNAIHALAHGGHRPAPVRWLQRAGLLLPPRHHALHHRAGHDRAFCITTGWCNRVLDPFDAFGRAARAVRGFGRVV